MLSNSRFNIADEMLDISRAAWWFQKGNVVRSEATVNLDLKTKASCHFQLIDVFCGFVVS
jgi:hypothetical protein